METNYDWTTFDIYFYYHKPLTEVWQAWATSRGLCSFFLQECETISDNGSVRESSHEFQAGDQYRWLWQHGYELKGSILEVVSKKLLAFTFGDMRVDLDFKDTNNGIQVHLKQTGIGNTEPGRVYDHLNCRSCWIFFMTNLLSVLQQGFDLRDTDSGRVSSMEVGYKPSVIQM